MLTRIFRLTLVLTGLLLLGSMDLDGHSSARAQNPIIAPRYDLFYNYYVGPPGVPAAMYVSPRPTPPFVGHTYITNQALLPQEFLYRHHRSWHRWGGAYTLARYW